MSRSLNEMKIEGVKTIIPMHQLILQEETFKADYHNTDFLEKYNIVQSAFASLERLYLLFEEQEVIPDKQEFGHANTGTR